MSSELVPVSYARDAYNVLHGTELKTHTDALTAEQATRINNNYDIEVHVGTHGRPPGAQLDNPYALLTLPTQQEYEEAAAVVAGMQPGDTLFLEGYGFNGQPSEPAVIPDRLPSIPGRETATPSQKTFGELALSLVRELKADTGRRLEQSRADYKISAWDYAQQLAALKDIRTVYADHDAFEKESLQALGKGKGLMELANSPSDEYRALAERMDTQRERKARNMMKDWALDHLPREGTPAPSGRKPKLVLLFGGAHQEGLERTFNNLGLDTDVTVMKSTDIQGRAGEQVVRVLSDAATALIPSLIGAPTEASSKVGALVAGGDRLKGLRAERARDQL